MCGIAGILVRTDAAERLQSVAHEAVQGMLGRLLHRGPDGQGVELVSRTQPVTVVLGHTRLAILDLSPAGRQPMLDRRTNNRITCNGEIYNYRELHQILDSGETWTSTSDTEVILRAYARWGR